MSKIFGKITALVIYASSVVALIYLILTGLLGDLIIEISDAPLLGYSILLFVLSSLFMGFVLYRSKTYTPSLLLFVFFLAVPILGYFSYEIFIDMHGNFFGKQLSFNYPLFVWAIGTTAFFAGLFIPYLVSIKHKKNRSGAWDPKRVSFLLWISLGISLAAAVIVVARIGHLPILNPDINTIRVNYESMAGRYPAKFSRLFLIVSVLSTILFFLKKNKLYLGIFLVSSVFGLTLFGERMPLFWAICFFALVFFKFYKLTRRQVLMLSCVGLCVLFLFLLFAEHRAGRLEEGISFRETIILPLFSEFSYYAYVVDDISESGHYLEEDILWGAFVVLLPRQIWAAFDVDKDYVMKKNFAVHLFGEKFRDPMGTRITPIGEAYAEFGVLRGVCLQLLMFGLAFGILERWYLSLDKLDPKLCMIAFLLSLFLWLPIATLRALLNPLILYGVPLLICQLIATRRLNGMNNRPDTP